MAKPKIPNQKSKYNALNRRLATYVAMVRRIYDTYNIEAAKMATLSGYDGEKPFKFTDYPILRDRTQKLFSKWRSDLFSLITVGTSNEWGKSNITQDLLADKALAYYYSTKDFKRKRQYYQKNSDALKAFQQRKDNGLTLSQKIWNQSSNYKQGLEAALSSGIEKGIDAVTLSKRVSKYLNDFDSLRKDYKEKYGKALETYDCEYRSIRLARSEINMAYRTAEQTRWQQFDFVVGYEIKLSTSHEHRMPHGDICDELKGKYPKDFVWTGWHPNDMCYCIPILKTYEEFDEGNNEPSVNEVTDVPQNYKEWCSNNANRIYEADDRGTLPSFITDNYKTTMHSIEARDTSIKGISESDVRYLASKGLFSRDYIKQVSGILSSSSPAEAQKIVKDNFTSMVTHKVFDYAEIYKGRNPEIEILISSIKRMDENDEITKIKRIYRLKEICAEECINDLENWGHTKGLKFIKYDFNHTISNKTKLTTSQGKIVQIEETKNDLIVFKDSEGRKFGYPLGVTKDFYKASDASKVISDFPEYLKRGIKRVDFLNQDNPFDKYWRIEYNEPSFISAASDGGETTFFITPPDSYRFRKYMAHEAGHILDGNSHVFSSSKGWLEAVAKDDDLYKDNKSFNRVSIYARKNDIEDFAECMSAFINDYDTFAAFFPNRAAFISEKTKKLSLRFSK